MDNKDLSCLFLAMIIVYGFSFEALLAATQFVHFSSIQSKQHNMHNHRKCEYANQRRTEITDENEHDLQNNSQQHNQPPPINLVHNLLSNHEHSPTNPSQIRTDTQPDSQTSETTDPLLLIEPHKPRLNTLSGNQHHIVEYHNLHRSKHPTPNLSESILKLINRFSFPFLRNYKFFFSQQWQFINNYSRR